MRLITETMIVSRITAVRMALGLSMRDLAGICDLSVATVSRAESGKDVSLAHAMRISRALNRTIEELWMLDDTPQASTQTDPMTEDIERLADRIGMGSAA